MQEHIQEVVCIDRLKANVPGLVEPVIAHFYNVSLDDMRAGTRRGAKAAFARQIAMYLMHVVYGLSMSEVAGNFGRDRSTASENLLRAAAHIEVKG